MSHESPSRDLAVIVERAIDLLLEKLETSGTLEALRTGRGPVPWSSPIEDLLRAAVQMLAT